MKRPLVLSALAVLGSGCGVVVEGDFSGVPFTPDTTVLAFVDQQELIVSDGAITLATKSRGAQTVHVLLTAASIDPNEDWRRYTADTLLEVKRELATVDGVYLKNVPLARFADGETLAAVVEEGTQDGDFEVFVGTALPPPEAVAAQGLGAKLRVSIDPRGLNLAEGGGGSVSANVSVQREREAGQSNEVATGEVTLSFTAPLRSERLSESNVSVAEPVLACMQAVGPARAASCRDVDALPYVDETGLVAP